MSLSPAQQPTCAERNAACPASGQYPKIALPRPEDRIEKQRVSWVLFPFQWVIIRAAIQSRINADETDCFVRQKAKGKRQKAKGKGQRAKGKGQRAKGKRAHLSPFALSL